MSSNYEPEKATTSSQSHGIFNQNMEETYILSVNIYGKGNPDREDRPTYWGIMIYKSWDTMGDIYHVKKTSTFTTIHKVVQSNLRVYMEEARSRSFPAHVGWKPIKYSNPMEITTNTYPMSGRIVRTGLWVHWGHSSVLISYLKEQRGIGENKQAKVPLALGNK